MIFSILDASYFWSSVSPVVDSAQLQVAHMAANLTEAVSAMVNDIQLNIAAADFTPDDYNPPRYEYAGNASMESHTQTRRSQVGFSPSPHWIRDLALPITDISDGSTRHIDSHCQHFYRQGYR